MQAGRNSTALLPRLCWTRTLEITLSSPLRCTTFQVFRSHQATQEKRQLASNGFNGAPTKEIVALIRGKRSTALVNLLANGKRSHKDRHLIELPHFLKTRKIEVLTLRRGFALLPRITSSYASFTFRTSCPFLVASAFMISQKLPPQNHLTSPW